MGIENQVPMEDGREEAPKKEITDAVDLDELCEILTDKKELVNKKGRVWSAQEDLIPAIQSMKLGVDTFIKESDLSYQQIINVLFDVDKENLRKAFTRTEGLRDKVYELIKKYAEEAAKKHVSEMMKFKPDDQEK